MSQYVFVTGTDTGVGKTEFTVALTRWLRANGCPAVALKPLASGDRGDAVRLERAQDGLLPLDWINPWVFERALAPLAAARLEGRRVAMDALIHHIRATASLGDPVIVEGAGGLLSPMLEKADAPELIAELKARTVVIASNRLGVVNQVRLVWSALSAPSRKWAQIVLMEPARADDSTGANEAMLGEYIDPRRIHGFPRLRKVRAGKVRDAEAARVLSAVCRGLGIRAGGLGG